MPECYCFVFLERYFVWRRINHILPAETQRIREPRWPAVLFTFSMAAIPFALPEHLTLGPSWFVPLVSISLVISAVCSNRAGKFNLNATFGVIILSVITAVEVWSLALLIRGLPHKNAQPLELARSAALRAAHSEGAFLFRACAI
jgi:hypothetical protein